MCAVFGAAIDAHRRSNNSASAVKCLYDMIKCKLEPTASHYNLVLRALRQDNQIEKMLKMAMSIIEKEQAKINANTFEIVIEALLEAKLWKQTLSMISLMEKYGFKPQIQVYVSLIELLEQARQYKAVLALYRVMARNGYDFYENPVLNGEYPVTFLLVCHILRRTYSISCAATADRGVQAAGQRGRQSKCLGSLAS